MLIDSVGIVQPGSSGNATLDGNLKIWILDNPGTSYTSGPATSEDGLELLVGVAEALIQLNSGMVQTVVFGSVND